MLETLGLEDLEQQIADILESDAFQAVIYIVMAYVVLIWLASAYWAYRDMRVRTTSAVTPYMAALALILFTPVFFLFGLLVYRIVRPKETIAEVNERTLAEETMLAEVATHAQCANCSRPVHEDWIICPTCRNRLRRVCPNCEHLIELDWTLCAWCGKDFERAESPGTTAFMPSARPAQLPGGAPRMPAPMPPAATRQAPPQAPPPAGRPAPAPKPGPRQAEANAPKPPTQPQSAAAPAPRSSGASTSASGSAQPPTGF